MPRVVFHVCNSSGVPLAGLAAGAAWEGSEVLHVLTGASAAAPTISAVTGEDGAYYADLPAKYVGVVDFGATAYPRWVAAGYEGADAATVMAVADSGPLTGRTLTWHSLVNADTGAPYTPQPAFAEIGHGLYRFTPVASARLVGWIDLTSAADPRYWSYDSTGSIPVGAGAGASYSLAPVEQAQDDLYGKDLLFTDDLYLTAAGDYQTIEGPAALWQSVYSRLRTRQGEYKLRPGYGAGVPSYVKKPDTEAHRDRLRHDILEQIAQEDRIERVEEVSVERPTIDGRSAVRVTVRVRAFGRELRLQPFIFMREG